MRHVSDKSGPFETELRPEFDVPQAVVTPGRAAASELELARFDHVTGSALVNATCPLPLASPCSPRLLAFIPARLTSSRYRRRNALPPSLAGATGARLLDNRQPTSHTTRATARSRVPVRIHVLAGDTYYPYRFI